jgi:PHD/YefM family antitoxin component YafN of YafNO toxin-antitoxin module
MNTKTVSNFREELAETLEIVAYTKRRIAVKRRNKVLAVIVPPEDAELLEQLEDEYDLAEVRRVLRDPAPVSFDEALTRAGLTRDDIRDPD